MNPRRSPRKPRALPSSGGGVPLPPDEPLQLTLYLKHPAAVRRRPGSAADLAELTRRVSRDELAAERARLLAGPIEVIRRFAAQAGMQVLDVDPARRRVALKATPAAAERAFSTKLRRVEHAGRHYHCPRRAGRVPPALAEIVDAVLGLDARPRLRRLRSMAGPAANGLYPSAIARLYGIEAPRRGAGQSLAIVEPAGGYARTDLEQACRAMGLPVPRVVDVAVGHGRNAFGADPLADREVSLDVQVAAAVAPEAHLAVYFTESTESGLADGLAEAVHDKTHRPDVIVITWGEPEVFWPPAARKAMDGALADAVRLGVTVLAASGDDLATERMNDGRAHVDYPASSPYVLGCGGTAVTLDATGASIASEVVWNEAGARGTGGGISDLYAVPAYQRSVTLPASANNDGRRGRGVPDVAAAAAETNGYRIVLHDSEVVASGTSAVAPLWGAFIALINAERGHPLGLVNSTLYRDPRLFRPVTSGNNVAFGTTIGYRAGPEPGWNACTGLGAPQGAAIIAALTAVA